ncbi:MAG: hypothetical protein R8F63_17675 [Acidimicrobiales bacterium]|nr:hypothetical protein [Acidimicrobiales bacterium]
MPVRIAAARRSPFAGTDGALGGWHPVDLAATLMNATVADPAIIDEVWLGCTEPVGAQGADMARAAILTAGWPDRIGGTVVDRGETSGTAALHAACAALEAGDIGRAVVVGVCSASVVAPGASALARTYGRPWGDGPATRVEGEGGLLPAPAAADRAATAAGIGRTEQDEWTTGSHERRGLLAPATIEPVDARPGERAAIQRGTPITADVLRVPPEDPAAMPPSFDPAGTVTGFTFSPPADGVTVIELTTAEAEGRPRITARARSAGHPLDPTGDAAAAIRVALQSAGLPLTAITRWEVAEPTAAATLLVIERAGLDPERVNIAGGALAVGDTAAAEELRLVVDGVGHAGAGDVVGCVAFGPTGAAVTILACP